MQERNILSIVKAAEILGISSQRVSLLCTQGRIAFSAVGSHRLPYQDSVLDYQASEKRRKYSPKRGKNIPRYLRKGAGE